MLEKNNMTKQAFDDEIEVGQLFYRIIRKWKIFAVVLSLSVISTVLFISVTEPVFSAKEKISIADQSLFKQSRSSNGFSSIEPFVDMPLGTVEDVVEVFCSSSLLRDVILENKLYIDQFDANYIRDVNLYGVSPIDIFVVDPFEIVPVSFVVSDIDSNGCHVFAEEFNIDLDYIYGDHLDIDGVDVVLAKNNKNNFINTDSEITISLTPIYSLIQAITSKLEINNIENTNVISLIYEDVSIDRSIDLLSSIVRLYNEKEISYQKEVSSITYEFISNRLNLIDSELNQIEMDMESFQKDRNVVNIGEQSLLLMRKSDQLDEDMFILNTDLKIMNAVLAEVSNVIGVDYAILPDNLPVDLNSYNISKYNEILLDRSEKMESIGPKNKLIRKFNEQLAMLSSSIEISIKNGIEKIELQIKDSEKERLKIDSILDNAPSIEREFRTLQRRQKLSEDLYLYLLQRKEEARIKMEASGDKARVVEEPFSSRKQIYPVKYKIIVCFVLGTLFLLMFIIIMIEIFDNRVSGKRDLERYLGGITFLGEVMNFKIRRSKSQLKVDHYMVRESYSLLRDNLELLDSVKKIKTPVYLVTSTMPNEGKSYTASNLAYSYASIGKKVLIIGADLRKPSLHKLFPEVKKYEGLSNYLLGKISDVSSIVQKTSLSNNLHVISSGEISNNPTLLMEQNDKLDEILAFAKKNYDLIFIDTVPSFHSEIFPLAKLADATIYVIKCGLLHRDALMDIEDMNKRSRFNNMLTVLNCADGYTGYKYRYGEQ